MNSKRVMNKAMAMAVAAAMAVDLCPVTAFAVTKEQVAADGLYTGTAHVTRIEEEDADDEWNEYDISVNLSIEDGKIKNLEVVPGTGYDTTNASYVKKAVSNSKKNGFLDVVGGKDATETSINSWTIDAKSGATRTQTAVKTAALDAIHKAAQKEENTEKQIDTSKLEESIGQAEGKNKEEYTEASWKNLEEKLTEAKKVLSEKESQEAVDTAKTALDQAVADLIDKTTGSEGSEGSETQKPEVTAGTYVLMNIPYAKFYQADLNNSVAVDAFTSATKNKVRTESLAGGSYHVDNSGDEITGVTFPVKLGEGVDLSKFTEITEDSSVAITVTNRGQTSTTTYTGKDALFESASYSYYTLKEAPVYYKEVTVQADGSLSFGKTQGTAAKVSGVTPQLYTETSYGDYQLDLDGLTDTIPSGTAIYGVIVSTKEGSDYGMRHLENIWRVSELAWSTGFTTAVHGCPTSSEHYKAMMGQHINKVTYYTANGIYEIAVNDLYVPKKAGETVSVADAKLSAGETAITFKNLPEDFEPEYQVSGLDFEVKDGKLIFKNAKKGSYLLTVTDKSGIYADMTATFILTADAVPAAYNEDGETPAIKKAEGVSDEEYADFLKNITSVSVNGTAYAASGRGAVKLVNEDGTLITDAAPLADGTEFKMVVKSTGYPDLEFTYVPVPKDVYVLMNIPYDQFYKADVNNEVKVDAFTSATKNKVRTESLAGGSYHVDNSGDEITGVTFPVKVPAGTDLSKYTQITDDSKVSITVTNRGQESTTEYTGKDALFESATYSYYTLSEKPEYYKELTVQEDGSFSFGETKGTATTISEGVDAELLTSSSYGDYQLDLDGLTDTIPSGTAIYGVIVSTKEGSDYGMRHLENIWRVSELAWSTGFTAAVHGCPTSSEHYKAMMGQHINKVTYYTANGIYEIPVGGEEGLYVPVKFASELAVSDAELKDGESSVATTLSGLELPADFDPEYTVYGAEVEVKGTKVVLRNVKKGKYTLIVTDKNEKYAPIETTFEIYAEVLPAAYNEDGTNPALKKAAGSTDAEFADFLKNITSVSVNGTAYAASGRGAVTLIKEDGTLVKDAEPFAQGDSFEIVVTATGYKDLSFTYQKGEKDPVVQINTASLEKAIQTAEGLKEAEYSADSWKVLQVALKNAKSALETKKDQTTVDNAAASLNKAIEALVKVENKEETPTTTVKPSGSNNTTITTGNKGTTVAGSGSSSTSTAVKTGDPTNLFSMLGIAISSMGAGGFAWKRRKREKQQK